MKPRGGSFGTGMDIQPTLEITEHQARAHRMTAFHDQVPALFSGGGPMAARMLAHDWSSSPLGPPRIWPAWLSSTVSLMLGSRFPMFVAFGPDLGFLYNDAYAEILGTSTRRRSAAAFKISGQRSGPTSRR